MRQRRYDGYHGRPGAWDILKVILCLLVILLVLTVAGLIVGQRYLVYTDDGVRLELPFFQREQTPPNTSAPVDIVQLPGRSDPEPEPSQDETEQPKPEDAPEETPMA